MNSTNSNVPNIADFEASTCGVNSRASGKGGLSIVNCSNGKRITLNATVLKRISNPTSIQIAYSDEFIAISSFFGENHTNYPLKSSGTSAVIYNSTLVKEITERYELDFTNRTSLTFSLIVEDEQADQQIIYIKMKSGEE